MDDLALLPAWQIEVAHEHVARVAAAFVAITRALVGPVARSGPVVRIAMVGTRTTPELPRVVITIAIRITVAEIITMSGPIPLLIAIATIPLARIIVAIAWVVAPTGIVKHPEPP